MMPKMLRAACKINTPPCKHNAYSTLPHSTKYKTYGEDASAEFFDEEDEAEGNDAIGEGEDLAHSRRLFIRNPLEAKRTEEILQRDGRQGIQTR